MANHERCFGVIPKPSTDERFNTHDEALERARQFAAGSDGRFVTVLLLSEVHCRVDEIHEVPEVPEDDLP